MWQYTFVLQSFKYSMIPGWLLKYVLSPSKILYNPSKKKLNINHILRGIGKKHKTVLKHFFSAAADILHVLNCHCLSSKQPKHWPQTCRDQFTSWFETCLVLLLPSKQEKSCQSEPCTVQWCAGGNYKPWQPHKGQEQTRASQGKVMTG